jgi:hypothetical protein
MKRMELTIAVTNSSDRKIRFRLEPWGDEKQLEVNESVQLKASGPSNGVLEVEYSGDSITVYGWENSICEVQPEAQQL